MAKPEIPAGLPRRRDVPEMPSIVPERRPPSNPVYAPAEPATPVRAPLDPVPVGQ